jgi:hypothetical protein
LYLIFLLGRDRAGRKGVCGRLMSPAHETQSMREIRLLRGRLQRKGGGLTGMYLFLHYFYIFLARFTSLRLCCTLFIICCQQSSSLEYCFFSITVYDNNRSGKPDHFSWDYIFQGLPTNGQVCCRNK